MSVAMLFQSKKKGKGKFIKFFKNSSTAGKAVKAVRAKGNTKFITVLATKRSLANAFASLGKKRSYTKKKKYDWTGMQLIG